MFFTLPNEILNSDGIERIILSGDLSIIVYRIKSEITYDFDTTEQRNMTFRGLQKELCPQEY